MDKIAFHIPFYWRGEWNQIPVHWYGVLVAAGFLAGLWTASRRAPRDGIPGEKIMDLGPWLIIGSIIGARLLYVVTHWRQDFAGKPFVDVFMVQRGGLVYYGGLIGATILTWIYLAKQKLPVWKFADAVAPSISLGYFFGRFGCLMNGCCYGKPTDVPWAIRFPAGHGAEGPVHPTQIYDAMISLGLYAALAWLYRRKKFDGQIFAIYLIAYAILRAVVESFRGDYPVYYGGFLTPAQMVSIFIFTAGVVLYWQLSRATPQRQPA